MDQKKVLESLWTARWNLNKAVEKIEAGETNYKNVEGNISESIEKLEDAKKIGLTLASNPVQVVVPEIVVDRPHATGRKLLWYPDAKIPSFRQRTRGKYPKGFPEGLVIHWIWAPQTDKEEFWAQYGKDEGYVFFTLGKSGGICQAFPLDEWGHHAGVSAWVIDGKKVSSVSNRFAGVEVVCEGKVSSQGNGKYGNGPGRIVPAEQLRYIPANKDNIQAGYYQKFTAQQEKELIELCLWMKAQAPDVFSFDNVVGHDEVAGPKGIGTWRKVDPGGSLSMTMSEFRQLLKTKWNEMS